MLCQMILSISIVRIISVIRCVDMSHRRQALSPVLELCGRDVTRPRDRLLRCEMGGASVPPSIKSRGSAETGRLVARSLDF